MWHWESALELASCRRYLLSMISRIPHARTSGSAATGCPSQLPAKLKLSMLYLQTGKSEDKSEVVEVQKVAAADMKLIMHSINGELDAIPKDSNTPPAGPPPIKSSLQG